MKILVLGASGQVGNLVKRIGERRGHAMCGTYKSQRLPGLVRLDLADRQATRRTLRDLRPDRVVNCAGWTWVDGNERDPDRAQRENVETVASAADATAEIGARWCYLSSSYVFDGAARGPYRETDTIQPISVYGRTKARAEQITRSIFGDDGLIVRTIVVWGPEPQGKNFAHRVVRSAITGTELSVPSDQLGNPTYGPDLAACLISLLESGAGGIWNVAGPEAGLNRADFARAICRALDLDDGFIRPVTTASLEQAARRPLNASLATEKLETAGLALRPTREALAAWRSGEWEWPWPEL